MDAKYAVALVLATVLVVASAAAALPARAHDQAQDHADEHANDHVPDDAGDASDGAADAHADDAGEPSDNALFGLCTAYRNNKEGRDHGEAGDAGPFQWLVNLALGAVGPFCDDAEPPAQGAGAGAASAVPEAAQGRAPAGPLSG